MKAAKLASLGAADAPDTGRLIAFVGGLRSGKSELAQQRFADALTQLGLRSPVYLATLLAAAAEEDPEIAARLAAHRRSRPTAWATLDVGSALLGAAERCAVAGHDAWFLDGLGAWAALQLGQADQALLTLKAYLAMARQVPLAILVLDEVGQAGVPAHPVARAFADLNGSLNQVVCREADEVWSVQAGLTLRLK